MFALEANLSLAEIDSDGQKLCLKWKSIISSSSKINKLEEQLKKFVQQKQTK
jgi:hypothetical protein